MFFLHYAEKSYDDCDCCRKIFSWIFLFSVLYLSSDWVTGNVKGALVRSNYKHGETPMVNIV